MIADRTVFVIQALERHHKRGAVVLLLDAAHALNHAATWIEQEAITPDVLQFAREAIEIAQDGCTIGAIDRSEPTVGIVESDGERG